MKFTHFLAFIAAAAAVSTSQAAVQSVDLNEVQAKLVFYDNFDANTSGRNAPPANWAVSLGTVDVVGLGDQDYLPGNGLYVDLDGTTNLAGALSTSFQLESGVTYNATYTMAGSQRRELALMNDADLNDIVDVTFGDSTATYTFAPDDVLATFTQTFTAPTTGLYQLTFDNRGGDLIGALLMEVTVATVPEPASGYAMLLGLAATIALVTLGRKQPRTHDE